MRYRPHKGRLDDSMALVATFKNLDALIFYMREVELKPYGFRFNDSQVRVTPMHMDDDRIGWKDIHIVTIDGYGVMGFTEGPAT